MSIKKQEASVCVMHGCILPATPSFFVSINAGEDI